MELWEDQGLEPLGAEASTREGLGTCQLESSPVSVQPTGSPSPEPGAWTPGEEREKQQVRAQRLRPRTLLGHRDCPRCSIRTSCLDFPGLSSGKQERLMPTLWCPCNC